MVIGISEDFIAFEGSRIGFASCDVSYRNSYLRVFMISTIPTMLYNNCMSCIA